MSENEFVDLSAVMNSNANHYRTKPDRNGDMWPTLDNPYVPQQSYEARHGLEEKAESQPNFPSDDQHSIQQGDGGTVNLGIYYAHQFVGNETHFNPGVAADCQYQLEYTPIINGTLTGSVVMLMDPDLGVWTTSQTLVFNPDGTCDLQTVQDGLAIGGALNQITGEMSLTFSEPPGEHKVVVSYEYNSEPVNLDPVGGFEEVDQMAKYAQGGEAKPVWGKQGDWSTLKHTTDKNSSGYIDYLINQLSETKGKLYDAEEKLAAIHNGGQKTLPELEVEMYNEYDKRLKDVKEYMITKLDQFLQLRINDKDELAKLASRPKVEIFEEAMNS